MNPKAQTEKPKYPVIWRQVASPTQELCEETLAQFFFEGFKGQLRAGQSLIHFGGHAPAVIRDFISKGLHVTLVDISPYSFDEEIRGMFSKHSSQLHFVQACLWQLPSLLKSAYWIFCAGVLEHLPEDSIEGVLEQMAQRMRFGGYISICIKEDTSRKKTSDPILTIRKKQWWEEKLLKHFSIVGEDVLAGECYFNCRVIKQGS